MVKKVSTILTTLFFSLAVFFFMMHGPGKPFPSERQFEVTYKAVMEQVPEDARRIQIWIPLASTREGQRILQREIKSPVAYQITRDPVHGNEMAYFELKPPLPQSLELEMTYSAEIAKDRFERDNGGRSQDAYLKSSTLMVVNDTVRERTREAVRGKETLVEKAKGIYENVIGTMRYDKTVPGWGRGDTARACLLGTGNCTDFHSLFISMAHAAEIPARFKIGLTVPDAPKGEIAGYHCWAEFYEEGKGWQPVDTSEAWKHPQRKEAYFGNFDTNKFLISVGRDIDLVPQQSGSPVNIFFYPYVEVDGKEWNGMKTAFQFKNLK